VVGSNAAWAHPVLYQRLAQAKRGNPRLRIVAIEVTADDMHSRELVSMFAAPINPFISLLAA
jgi:anaerobic selenocysteine-containing dehydrogenase